ncbi:hypothetical protein [Streptomyces sp. SS8]
MTALNHLESLHFSSIQDLRRAGGIKIDDESWNDPAESFSDLQPLSGFGEEWVGIHLDEDMLDDCLRVPGLAVHWHTRDPLPRFFGEYRVPDPLEILTQGPDPAVETVPPGFKRDFVSQLRYIDSAYYSGSGSMTYLRLLPNSSPLEIWHYELARIGGEPNPIGYVQLDLTYRQYIENLLITKGTRGWQYLFADISFQNSSVAGLGDHVKRMLEAFPSLFPEHDYSPLRERLEARL